TSRTADQTEVARFWSDGLGTVTPPGHWNEIASQVAQQQGNSLAANIRLFAELNTALADAAIVAWDAKYTYDLWRPVTAIQNATDDGNDATVADPEWYSFLITPNFPEYVSGHSTFSGAAAAVLNQLLGTDVSFTIDSQGLPGVSRFFPNFDAAADEAGRSRIYGGIHYEFSNQDGLSTGRDISEFVHSVFATNIDVTAPVIHVTPVPVATSSNLTIEGQITDNLSGVATASIQVDNGPVVPLTTDANGRFSLPTRFDSDGTYVFHIRAFDAAGNASLQDLRFVLDSVAPVLNIVSPSTGDDIGQSPTLSATIDGTGSIITRAFYALDGGSPVPLTAGGTALNVALNLANLGPGDHELTVSLTDAAGNNTTRTTSVTLAQRMAFSISSMTPASGSSDVGSTYRPQVHFTRPVDVSSLNAGNFYATDTTGTKIPAAIVPAAEGTFAWLFFNNPLPGASTVTLHVDGSTIRAAADAVLLDADGDGTPGGVFTSQFATVSLTPLIGTSLSGRVFDPGPDLKPMTVDDVKAGADGILHTADDVFLHPIANAKVFILGLESQVVYTDANGYFSFAAAPAGTIKLAIDGRTATNAPSGVFFPEMVMDLQLEVGRANTVMGTMGTSAGRAANLTRDEIYLPRVQTSSLQTVSNTVPTMITVAPESAANLTPEQRSQLSLTVQPGTAVDAAGNLIPNPQIGISTVPAELVRDMLPPGLMQHTFDITIQAPGVAAFDTPLTMTFPNIFGAAPGTQLNFLSFDHTTGRLVIEGTTTVSPDGRYATTDPGQGITKPGWHGLTPPGSQNDPPCDPNAVHDVNVTPVAVTAGVTDYFFK
ncbi:MAG: phosphatase PAP2 family protein, partial [Planctomycetaceae bacterium]|nr:phosphatase PAP2 family protein [Planctomycetaceae bacterium]